jgi:hypothetical protein
VFEDVSAKGWVAEDRGSAARRHKVDRRVKHWRGPKYSKDETLRRRRLGDLRRLIEDRCGPILPDDDAGREYLKELLLPVSLSITHEAKRSGGTVRVWGPRDRMLQEIERWAPWMDLDEADEIITEINLMPEWERKIKARPLGDRLRLTYPERARLDLRTIAAFDMPDSVMAVIRRQKKKEQNKRRYNRSRADYLAANTKSKETPWTKAGMSRATWYRRRETTPRHINLTKTCLLPVSHQNKYSTEGECGRLSTPTPAGQSRTCVEDFGLTAGSSRKAA